MPVLSASTYNHYGRLRRFPLALEAPDEKTGRDDAVAGDTRRKWVVAQSAAHGAW